MKKSVSPAFAGIVIVIALVLGMLYFMMRYRAHEAQWQREAAAARAQAAQALTMRQSREDMQAGGARRGMPGGARSGEPAEVQGGEPGRSEAAPRGK